MNKKFSIDNFLDNNPQLQNIVLQQNIDSSVLEAIYKDYIKYINTYKNQADFIANILRSNPSIHTVKSRIKNPDRLIEKVIRKTENRKSKYGFDFQFSLENYKEEINDFIGIRVIHIFKEQWRDIHEFIVNTWKVVEISANVRDGDNVEVFDELDIDVISRSSGYRSVHYLIEFSPTNEKVIAEIQVRTIFEEGYGEIDHRLRYSHHEIPEILKSNLLLFNRIIGSADEMASLINTLSKEKALEEITSKELEYLSIIEAQRREIEALKSKIK